MQLSKSIHIVQHAVATLRLLFTHATVKKYSHCTARGSYSPLALHACNCQKVVHIVQHAVATLRLLFTHATVKKYSHRTARGSYSPLALHACNCQKVWKRFATPDIIQKCNSQIASQKGCIPYRSFTPRHELWNTLRASHFSPTRLAPCK